LASRGRFRFRHLTTRAITNVALPFHRDLQAPSPSSERTSLANRTVFACVPRLSFPTTLPRQNGPHRVAERRVLAPYCWHPAEPSYRPSEIPLHNMLLQRGVLNLAHSWDGRQREYLPTPLQECHICHNYLGVPHCILDHFALDPRERWAAGGSKRCVEGVTDSRQYRFVSHSKIHGSHQID
jgi:hypothetical protein